ncbi:hypothetical protein [Halovivax gelatinilyticus]|uniref:hypothetical protein n=1 Tax=Halovivax gelatinilyticus TaxID=2961597 RepID=UPI0020CA327D|nr:hypothetical protein [Halovivax gelatinilyticus]
MQVGLVILGGLAIGIGAALLYLTRHHAERLPVDEGTLDAIRLSVAIGAGILITIGLFMTIGGLLA